VLSNGCDIDGAHLFASLGAELQDVRLPPQIRRGWIRDDADAPRHHASSGQLVVVIRQLLSAFFDQRERLVDSAGGEGVPTRM
jgi:hypothetical protein